MPEDGAKPVNVAVLADAGSRLSLAIPVERLERIAGLLASREGMVSGSVAFSREEGRIVAEVELSASLWLRCQRCLQGLLLPIRSRSRVVLLANEEEAAGVPPELETALAPEGRLRPADLVEEELLLALPAAPRHAGSCPDGRRSGMQENDLQTQRPFAGLGELLGRPKH
ncbi:MAG TPA: YceD family protein [Steroidobacteraceae bacterium]|nr:YceD family protein [Steroidobacteraceae bacterium]